MAVIKTLELLRSQKNAVLEAIKRSGLDPFNFTWSTAPSRQTQGLSVSKLEYRGTDYFFLFDFARGKDHHCTFSPGHEKLVDSEYPGDWTSVFGYFEAWLDYLKEELKQPDLWEQIARYQLPAGTALSADASNEPFSVAQVDQVADALKQIQAFLETEADLSAEGRAIVDEKLDYLLEASRRWGRKDWIHLALGTTVTLATSVGLSPEHVRSIWKILGTTLNGTVPLIMP